MARWHRLALLLLATLAVGFALVPLASADPCAGNPVCASNPGGGGTTTTTTPPASSEPNPPSDPCRGNPVCASSPAGGGASPKGGGTNPEGGGTNAEGGASGAANPPSDPCHGNSDCGTETKAPIESSAPPASGGGGGNTQPTSGTPGKAATTGQEPEAGGEDANPLDTLGAKSPLCPQSGLEAAATQNCAGSGDIAHPYPLDNYGLDEQVQWGVTHLDNTFDRITQWIVVSLWHVMLYVFNGVLLMLEWAFSLDLLQKSMNKLASALQTLHDTVIDPFALAATAGLALWGIWNGLIRKKTIDTVRGLGLSLLCMIALLVVIGDPVDTLGSVTNASNGTSMAMLDSISRGTVNQPYQGVASAEQGLFNSVVLEPWCALQFASVDYCLSKPPGINQTVADTWLQDVPNSKWRTSLWQITGSSSQQEAREEGYGMAPPGKNSNLGDMYYLAGHPEKVALIGGGSTVPRLALLLLILVGMVGAIALFFYLAVRLLLAALFVLILVLFAPAMFLVAALGESGRLSVVAWLKRLLGAIVVKVVYALFLAVIVTASNLVADLELGFFATWLVFIAFWWGVLLKRKDLIGLLSLDHSAATPAGIDFEGAHGDKGMAQLYYGMRLAQGTARGARRLAGSATAAPRAALRASGRHYRREREIDRRTDSDVARDMGREELETRGRTTLERQRGAEHAAEVAEAQPLLEEEQRRSRRLAAVDQALAVQRTKRQSAQREASLHTRGSKGWKSAQTAMQRADTNIASLQRQRGGAQRELNVLRADPKLAQARATVNRRIPEVTQRDLHSWVSARREQMHEAPGSDANLWAAGIDPAVHRSASPEAQHNNLKRAQEYRDRDRELLERMGDARAGGTQSPLPRRERSRAHAEAKRTGRMGEYRERAAAARPRHRDDLRSDRRRRNVR